MKTIAFDILGFKFVKYGALAYIERNGFKFFIKAGSKFSFKIAGLELTNKQKIFINLGADARCCQLWSFDFMLLLVFLPLLYILTGDTNERRLWNLRNLRLN